MDENETLNWYKQSGYSENISTQKIKIKNFDIFIYTDYIVKYGLGFTKIFLSEEDAKNAKSSIDDNESSEADAKNGRSSIGSGKYKRYKSVSSGNLYYEIRINNWKEFSYGDWRIIYYKLATENKISILGEKKGNEIIDEAIVTFDDLIAKINTKKVQDKKAHFKMLNQELETKAKGLVEKINSL